MIRCIPFFSLLAMLTSCQMRQPEYYDAGYFHSVPPRVEIYGFDEHLHDYRHPNYGHRTTPKKISGAQTKNSRTLHKKIS